MKVFRAFLLGLLATVAVGAWAVQGGGFPSRPIFQALTVGSAFKVDSAGNITAPSAASVPWPGKTTLGLCQFKLTFEGASNPVVAGQRGCTNVLVVRSSAGSYAVNDATLGSAFAMYCTFNSSLNGPYVYISNVSGNAALLDVFSSTSGALVDPPVGAGIFCTFGS